MNIERKILVKLKNIHSLDQNKKLLRSGYHNQYNTFLSNISFVPVLSSSQLPPKNHLSLTSNHLNDYYYLNLPNDNTYTLDEIIKILKQHPDIEYVQKIPKLPVQPPNITPDLTRHQHYLKTPKIKSNEINGLGIIDAWNKNAYGQGIQVADIEWDFDLSHPDLLANNITPLFPLTEKTDQADHGTAVAGLIMGKKDGKGITGLAYKLDMFYAISELSSGRIEAIIASKQKLHAGDIVLYEMQTVCEHHAYVPADYEMHIWEATRTLTEAGIIVIMAAGYGDLFHGDGNNKYTANFSGTSSACALVAGAAAVIQSWYKDKTNTVLTPIEMRELLIKTGTYPSLNEKIGPLPNVNNAILHLKNLIQYN